LQEILDIARFLLSEIHTKAHAEIEEKESKLEQLKNVLEMYGHFSGINRKVQMKYQPKGRPRGSSSDDSKSGRIPPYPSAPTNQSEANLAADQPVEPSLVLILKWGGELTGSFIYEDFMPTDGMLLAHYASMFYAAVGTTQN